MTLVQLLVVIGCGPIFSYYEFKHPMNDRLTDEKWKTMLRPGTAPKLPGWTSSFGVTAAPRRVRPLRRGVRPMPAPRLR